MPSVSKTPTIKKPRTPQNLGITIGQINRLQIVRLSPHGAYLAPIAHAPKSKGLESSESGKVDSSKLPKTAPSPRQITHALYEVLLPKKFCPSQAQIGDTILAFVYTDSLDRPVATTQMPLAQCGEVAVLRVVGQTGNGVFLDLGLDKDIFMPSKTPAKYPLDSRVAVYITLDKSSRLIAKKDIQSHLLPYRTKGYARGKKVSILPFSVSDLGVSVVVDSRYYGLVYLPQSVRDKQKSPESTLAAMGLGLGLESSAFIHNVRKDGKLDLVLHKRDRADESAAKLLQVLRDNGGKLAVHYDSSPESTFALLGMSKKALKRALSDLLARKLIVLNPQVGIELV